MTRNDIKVSLKLYLGQRHAGFLQDYQSLALVVSQALGGGKGSREEVQPPKTKAEAELAFKSVFG